MSKLQFIALILFAALAFNAQSADAELKIIFPQVRTAYQTNEWIDLSIIRKNIAAIPASTLALTLTAADGGQVSATFDARAVALAGKDATATEHLHINAALLRPGSYKVEAACDGLTATAALDLYSHIRHSEYKLVNWGRADKPAEQLIQGEDSFGFNLMYGGYMRDTNGDFIRAGADFMSCCTMGGAHQMDIRMECDWSDPYVIKAGTIRVARQAFNDRLRGNVWGVHFYDEPGLTWGKDPENGSYTPHEVDWQHRSYESAFGAPPLDYKKLDANNAEQVKQWEHWARWKLGFMDAAWKEAQFGVSAVRPDYVSITQSQYGGGAFTDGYYFNVARSLPIISGHGGYDDYGPGYFNPSYTLEMARAREYAKPNWYLPTWYGSTPPDRYRLEQNLSFQTNLQGMISPPDVEPAKNAVPRQGLIEINQMFQRLGPIFNHMPVTKPPVAILYSLSQCIHAQEKDPANMNYSHQIPHGHYLPITYLAGKVIHQNFFFVVDEDILDGTLANDHKAIVLSTIDYLDPKVVTALEDYAANGGLVLLTADSMISVKGAIKLPVAPRMPDQEKLDELAKSKDKDAAKEMTALQTTGKWMEGALKLGQAIQAELDKKGIKPPVECDNPNIIITRQTSVDVDYIFAVNAAFDEVENKSNSIKAATATLAFDGALEIYDAVRGGSVSMNRTNGAAKVLVRFGPGEMRVFACCRTQLSRPQLTIPHVSRNMLSEQAPLKVAFDAHMKRVPSPHDILPAAGNGVPQDQSTNLAGAVPMQVTVTDPLNVERYRLYRATENGTLHIELPLAINDPAGIWTLTVEDLLNNGHATTTFVYEPPTKFGAIAGETQRAVIAANDKENAFRFARLFHEVTLVKGKSDFNNAAAERLAKILQPWGVICKTMDLAAASKARVLTEEEAKTWCGLGGGRSKPGEGGSNPKEAGFAVQGPVILLGTPEDNPLIKYLHDERYLPYVPAADQIPGRARGMVAWQRDAIGRGQESIALIAYDEAGLNEAVGSFYEAIAGMDPLTKYALPTSHKIVRASTNTSLEKPLAQQTPARVPDRVDAFRIDGNKLVALSHDGSECELHANALTFTAKALTLDDYNKAVQTLASKPSPEMQTAMKAQSRSDRMLKFGITTNEGMAFAYWGGDVSITDKAGKPIANYHLPQDVTALIYFGNDLVAGLADGRIYKVK